MTPLEIAGYTGLESDQELWVILQGIWSSHPDPDARHAAMDLHYKRYGTARLHNTIAPMVHEYARATRLALGKQGEAAEEFASLGARTTTAWHACHHRFHLATVQARDLLAKRVDTATDIRATLPTVNTMTTPVFYAELVPAGQRLDLNLLPDPEQAKADLAEFVELSAARFATARVTLTGAVPAGFEPFPSAAAGNATIQEEVRTPV